MHRTPLNTPSRISVQHGVVRFDFCSNWTVTSDLNISLMDIYFENPPSIRQKRLSEKTADKSCICTEKLEVFSSNEYSQCFITAASSGHGGNCSSQCYLWVNRAPSVIPATPSTASPNTVLRDQDLSAGLESPYSSTKAFWEMRENG